MGARIEIGTAVKGGARRRQGIGRHEQRPLIDRFWEKVQMGGPCDCWIWTATTNGRPGYGIFRGGPERDKSGSLRWILAHRFAYELKNGPIASGMEIDHLCRNRRCVNPAHLEVVTHAENTLRSDGPSARAARMTACPRGHEFSAENTIVDKSGKRRCRACTQAREAVRTEKRRAQRQSARRAVLFLEA